LTHILDPYYSGEIDQQRLRITGTNICRTDAIPMETGLFPVM
jgi:hypothetical protein